MKRTLFYRNQMSAEEQKAYDSLLNGYRRFEKTITVEGNINEEQLSRIINSIDEDYPELFFLEGEYNYTYSSMSSGKNRIKTVTRDFIYDMKTTQSYLRKLQAVADSLIYKLTGQSAQKKYEMLHDYLVKTIVYRKHEEEKIAYRETHSIIGALLNKECVCEGIAKAYKYLCDRAGLECIAISGIGTSGGESDNHAWNLVRINGKYYGVDATFDLLEGSQYRSKVYFLLSDKEMFYDHTLLPGFVYPQCSESLCPLSFARDMRELERFLLAAFKIHSGFSEYRLANPLPCEQFIKEMDEIFIRNPEMTRRLESYIPHGNPVVYRVSFLWKQTG